jgi:hypothetical protein
MLPSNAARFMPMGSNMGKLRMPGIYAIQSRLAEGVSAKNDFKPLI